MLYGPFAPDGIEIVTEPGERIVWGDIADQLQEPRGKRKDPEVLEINGYKEDGSYYSFSVSANPKTGRIGEQEFQEARDEAGV